MPSDSFESKPRPPASPEQAAENPPANPPRHPPEDPARRAEPGTPPGRFTRVIDLYGEEGFGRLRAATVTVLGLGGVGAHAAISLARTGVGRLVLADHDRLTASSLNRFPGAGPRDVGRLKAEFLRDQLTRTCPDTATQISLEFFHLDQAEALFTPRPAIVADAIDSLNPKVALLEYCVRAGLPVVSSMGASARRDPTRIRVDELAATSGCPLARQIRRRLRRRGVVGVIRCVYSLEEGGPVLPPDPHEPQNTRGRIRNRLPSQITIPGIFGYALAHAVIEELVGECASGGGCIESPGEPPGSL